MKMRKLGKSGLEVSPLCFGGNVFGWTADEATSFKLLDEFVGSGFNFIDTADVYARWAPGNSGGESETIIGKWLKKSGKRDKVIIATKCGIEMGPDKKGLSKRYIKQAVEASLKRLQTDYIDLYQSHRDDPETPLLETMEAFSQLVKEGKARAIGASNYGRERLTEALAISESNGLVAYESLQPLYNLYDRQEFESQLEPICLKHEVAVISYFSLAAGFLSGKYRKPEDLKDKARAERVKEYLNDRGLRILKALDKVAKDHATTQASVALAWLLARKSVTAPIVSATSTEQLKSLFDVTKVTLDKEAIALLDQASAYEAAVI
jgi:aryl-alcohol dehydrogenase-like predicted oxidoreductase